MLILLFYSVRKVTYARPLVPVLGTECTLTFTFGTHAPASP
jgi:hypothetical protein